jgi:hypothetical protein
MLNILKTLWMLPVSILVWLFYILPLWATSHIRYEKRLSPIVLLFRVNKEKTCWYARSWQKWWGCSLPHTLILHWDIPDKYIDGVISHEFDHEHKWENWGIFFTPAYWGATIFIWLFQKNKHAYLDNPFERSARKAAGELVDIPRERWMDGPNDRFPWW